MVDKKELLKIFSVGKEPLATGGRVLVDDLWVTGVDVDIVDGEFENEDTGHTQITHNLEVSWSADGTGDTITTRFGIPTDRATGEIAVNEDGTFKRPTSGSKWGRFESMAVAIGIPACEDPSVFIGLHAHMQYKKIYIQGNREISQEKYDDMRTANNPRNRAINLSGYYPIEWDGYNNEIREAFGLEKITTRPETADDVADLSTNDVSPSELEAAQLLLESGTYLEFRSRTRDNVGLSPFRDKAVLDSWMEKGLVARENGKYVKGEMFDLMASGVVA